MKHSFATIACCICLAGVAHADDGLINRTESAVGRAAEATAHGIKRGVEATGHGIEVGLSAAGRGIRRGAEATGHALHKVAEQVSPSSGS